MFVIINTTKNLKRNVDNIGMITTQFSGELKISLKLSINIFWGEIVDRNAETIINSQLCKKH